MSIEKRMKRFSLLFISLYLACSAYSQGTMQRLLGHPALKHASVGVCVTDLNTGQIILSHDADKSLTPASTLKLVTTATALEVLGEHYRYKTDVVLDADDPSRILILGVGDPTLGSEAFGDNPTAFFIHAAGALKKALPDNQTYTVYVVDNLFGYDGVSPEWTWIDIGNYYAAGTYGVSIFDNSYKLVFNTTNRNVCPQILRTEPEIKGLTFDNRLSLNSSGQDNGYIYGVPFSYERALKGDIPGGRTEFSIKGDIPDPGLLLGETLADYLKRVGFRIGKVETARTDYISRNCIANRAQRYKAGPALCTQTSRPMKDIIREVNVQSNNHYAEHLIRTLGRMRNNDIYSDARQEGIDFTHAFWKEKGVTTSSLIMHDGCGLAPQNAASPAFLNDLLVYMYGSVYSPVFFHSLPKAGQEGTLRNFMSGTKYEGRISAKSGSIGGVQCYSGYLIDGNKKYAFTVMVNKFNGTRSQVRTAIEQFLLSL